MSVVSVYMEGCVLWVAICCCCGGCVLCRREGPSMLCELSTGLRFSPEHVVSECMEWCVLWLAVVEAACFVDTRGPACCVNC
jgi:hypothetical protein